MNVQVPATGPEPGLREGGGLIWGKVDLFGTLTFFGKGGLFLACALARSCVVHQGRIQNGPSLKN